MRKNKKKTAQRQARANPRHKLPLIEHVYELRRRLFYVAASVTVWSIAAYSVQQKIVDVLLRPAHGQEFIYTSPLGGMNFLFGVCLDIGLVLSTPVIVYNLLRFIQPLMRDTTARFVLWGSAVSALFALVGITFGYFAGLPAALNFLLHQFTSAQVKPLVTIQAYLSFVTVYLLGAALMFQLPLFIIFINRIKPLTPKTLFKYERHMIAGAFVIGFVMNPTPNIIDQLFVVFPIIISYQVGIGIIWMLNRKRPAKLSRQERDAQLQAERAARLERLQPLFQNRSELEIESRPTRVVQRESLAIQARTAGPSEYATRLSQDIYPSQPNSVSS